MIIIIWYIDHIFDPKTIIYVKILCHLAYDTFDPICMIVFICRWYHQQHMAMLKKGIKHPNPWGQFIKDIIQFIKDQQTLGREILLMMDANEEIGTTTPQGIAAILSKCSTTKTWGILVKRFQEGKKKAPINIAHWKDKRWVPTIEKDFQSKIWGNNS